MSNVELDPHIFWSAVGPQSGSSWTPPRLNDRLNRQATQKMAENGKKVAVPFGLLNTFFFNSKLNIWFKGNIWCRTPRSDARSFVASLEITFKVP